MMVPSRWLPSPHEPVGRSLRATPGVPLDLPPLAVQDPHGPILGSCAWHHIHSGFRVAMWAVESWRKCSHAGSRMGEGEMLSGRARKSYYIVHCCPGLGLPLCSLLPASLWLLGTPQPWTSQTDRHPHACSSHPAPGYLLSCLSLWTPMML